MDILRSLRNSLLLLMSGALMGGYVAYGYAEKQTEHIAGLADRGFCAGRDADHQRYWYSCQDAAVALELQARAVQHDQELAEADPIANLIRASEKKGKRK